VRTSGRLRARHIGLGGLSQCGRAARAANEHSNPTARPREGGPESWRLDRDGARCLAAPQPRELSAIVAFALALRLLTERYLCASCVLDGRERVAEHRLLCLRVRIRQPLRRDVREDAEDLGALAVGRILHAVGPGNRDATGAEPGRTYQYADQLSEVSSQ